MQKWHILSCAGVISMASALAVTPANASEDESEAESIALEARGTFEGFNIEPRNATIMVPDKVHMLEYDSAEGFVTEGFVGVPVPPDPEIISRDDVGLGGSVDINDTQPSVVQLFIQDNLTGGVFFNCTGTVINPRTILTAAHCLNSTSSESYGLPGVTDTSVLVSTGVDTSERLIEYFITGAGYNQGGVATSTDVVIHPSANLDNGALPFPWADVAFVAVDEPITDVPAMPILLSPLTELTHVVQVGYGNFGTAETGSVDIGTLRRVGENMLGAIGSPADLIDAILPVLAPTAAAGQVSQAYYFTDFDNPNRTPEEQAGCDFTDGGISCNSLAAVRAIDWFDDDALPNEVGTAMGDSGSPLIADELNGPAVVTAVLSGGFDFFEIGNTYSDISFYAPLYPFFEFISENTAYKYVSAKSGNGNWSDPNHWTQNLDPGFLIDDGTGKLVNGLPEGSEPGVYETGPKLGTIIGKDISDNADLQSAALPPEGTFNFGANTPESSALLGPGSTGFVPNNTDGTPGTSFENPAQYFDVFLNRFGGTLVDIDVEIDKLTLDHVFAALIVPEERNFTTIIGYEQFSGRTKVDGSVNAGVFALFGGLLDGTGTITTDALFNIEGLVAPGGTRDIGTLTIDGSYIQTSEGTLLTNATFRRRGNSADLLSITGDAGLAGNLVVNARGRARYGDEVTVLSANSVEGNFDDVFLLSRSPLLFAETRVDAGDVIVEINARRLRDLFNGIRNLESLGAALDNLRFSGRYTDFAGIFNIVDGASAQSLIPTLGALTPVSAFNQSAIATNFSQRFTGQLAQRTLSLHGANRAAGGFSAAGNTAFGIAGTNPQAEGQMGFFGTFSGIFLNGGQADRNNGAIAVQEAAFTQAGEMTLGMDMRVSDDLSLGFAMTNIRNSSANVGPIRQADDTSVAGAAYAAMQFGQGFADMHVGFARQRFGVERASQGDFNLAFNNAFGSTDGEQRFAALRVGYAFDVAPGFEMGPVASMDYAHSAIGGYSEYGAGDFGLNIQDRNFTSVGTKIGAMAAIDTRIGRTNSLNAFGSIAYAREIADTQDIVTATFTGAEDTPFSIANQLDPQWVSVNAGAELVLANRLSISFSMTSDFGRGLLSNDEARLAMNWRF